METAPNYTPSPERPTSTELTDGARMDFHRADPRLKTLEQVRRETAMAYEASRTHELEPAPHELIYNFGKGVVRLRVMMQQESLEKPQPAQEIIRMDIIPQPTNLSQGTSKDDYELVA